MKIMRGRIEQERRRFFLEDAAKEIGVTVFDDGHVGVILENGEAVMHIALSAPGARAVAERLIDASTAIESRSGPDFLNTRAH